NGADIIELGIPFSDPIADGPIFQAACERALKNGVTPARCLEAARKLRDSYAETPIIITTYFNVPYIMGFHKFMDYVRAAGAQGVLIPDLPVEEAEPYLNLAAKKQLHIILQVAPTTSERRLRRIANSASGFLYLISLEGVTGTTLKRTDAIKRVVKKVKAKSAIPLVVGFGIMDGKRAEAIVAAGADGVAVGSAYTKIYAERRGNPLDALPEIAGLAHEIKLGCILGLHKRQSTPSTCF
ncbi:MAG: tryptophan synthase subunit alpha, partial [Desulfurococcaceae archaeon]